MSAQRVAPRIPRHRRGVYCPRDDGSAVVPPMSRLALFLVAACGGAALLSLLGVLVS